MTGPTTPYSFQLEKARIYLSRAGAYCNFNRPTFEPRVALCGKGMKIIPRGKILFSLFNSGWLISPGENRIRKECNARRKSKLELLKRPSLIIIPGRSQYLPRINRERRFRKREERRIWTEKGCVICEIRGMDSLSVFLPRLG